MQTASTLPLPSEIQLLYQAKCKEIDEMSLDFEDFKSTSKFYEQELESQLSEITHKYEQLFREDQKLKSEFITIRKEKGFIESRNEQLSQENNRLKAQIKTLDEKIVSLENDLELTCSQKRQLETQMESLEIQINQDFEKFALLQVEFEEFQAEAKKSTGDLMEQLKEKEAEIQKNAQFLTPAKLVKPSISSNMSTRHSEMELNTISPKYEYFANTNNFNVKSIKCRKNTSEGFKNEKRTEDRKSLKMIDEIIKNLEKNMQIFC